MLGDGNIQKNEGNKIEKDSQYRTMKDNGLTGGLAAHPDLRGSNTGWYKSHYICPYLNKGNT